MTRMLTIGLFCAALGTLGVAVTRGETPAPVAGTLEVGAAPVQDVLVEIADLAVAEDPLAIDPVRQPESPADPETRQVLEKILGELRQKADRLQQANQPAEANRVRQAVQGLEHVVRGLTRPQIRLATPKFRQPQFVAAQVQQPQPARPAGAEVQRLMLAAPMAGLADPGVRQTLEKLIGDLNVQVAGLEIDKSDEKQAEAERKRQTIRALEQMLHAPAPQNPLQLMATARKKARREQGGEPPAGLRIAGAAPFNLRLSAPVARELEELHKKIEALRQAADRLQQGGLEEQARDMRQQAEQLQAEVQKRQQAMMTLQLSPPPGPGGPHEMQRALQELREQVQGLRDDVRQLRELLEKKPAAADGENPLRPA